MNFQLESAVKNIMTRDLHLLNIQDPISLVDKIFSASKLRHLPVVSNKKAVGMVDVHDLRLAKVGVFKDAIEDVTSEPVVLDFMHENPTCVHEDQTIKEVADLFRNGKHHALPVTNYDGVVGIVTTTDIIGFLLDKCESSSKKK